MVHVRNQSLCNMSQISHYAICHISHYVICQSLFYMSETCHTFTFLVCVFTQLAVVVLLLFTRPIEYGLSYSNVHFGRYIVEHMDENLRV